MVITKFLIFRSEEENNPRTLTATAVEARHSRSQMRLVLSPDPIGSDLPDLKQNRTK